MTTALLLVTVTSTIVTTVVVPAVAAGLATTATLTATRASEAAARRRDGYAEAVETLVAWIEFPYRIRRRVDDKPETLANLAAVGHQLQERLARHEAWITGEHGPVADAFRNARQTIGQIVGPYTTEAWAKAPITEAADMNLGDWGPSKAAVPYVKAFQDVVETRFGIPRIMNALRLRRHVK